jgi:large subunit ribosomal protein L32
VAVPKRKTTPNKRDSRRANHDKVVPVQLVACANCGEASRPHRACSACGYYKGRQAKITGAAE